MNEASPPSVVERMLDHAANSRWDELHEVLSPSFEIVEPESLPYGGVHHGVAGYIALIGHIGELYELAFEPDRVDPLDDDTVVLQMHVTFTARATGRHARLPVVDQLNGSSTLGSAWVGPGTRPVTLCHRARVVTGI